MHWDDCAGVGAVAPLMLKPGRRPAWNCGPGDCTDTPGQWWCTSLGQEAHLRLAGAGLRQHPAPEPKTVTLKGPKTYDPHHRQVDGRIRHAKMRPPAHAVGIA